MQRFLRQRRPYAQRAQPVFDTDLIAQQLERVLRAHDADQRWAFGKHGRQTLSSVIQVFAPLLPPQRALQHSSSRLWPKAAVVQSFERSDQIACGQRQGLRQVPGEARKLVEPFWPEQFVLAAL